MEITRFSIDDFQFFWPIFKRVVDARATVPIDPEISYDEAFETWCLDPLFTFVCRSGDDIIGSYFLKPNASGPGSHICNCMYMVDERRSDIGLMRLLCQHSQQVAIKAGFQAMQFNSVVASDSGTVQLWKAMGFRIIGAIPQGFMHKRLGLVDVYIMHKQLISETLDIRPPLFDVDKAVLHA